MGYENDFDNTVANTVRPMNRDRIKKTLEDNSWSYRVDSEGYIAGFWEKGRFFFELSGSDNTLFCVRGTWEGQPELDDYLLASSVCNRWNMDYYFPKTYVRVTEEREVFVHTEYPVSCHQGLSDAQLDEQIHAALSTSMDFFQLMEEKFPQALPDKLGDAEAKPKDS